MQQPLLGIAGLGWFLACTVIGCACPGVPLRPYVGAGGQLVMAATVILGLAAGRPFTTAVARQQAPREIWNHPVFLGFNRDITTGWAIGLGASAVIDGALIAAGFSSIGIQVGVIALGIMLPVLYQRRETRLLRPRLAGNDPSERARR